MNLTPFLGKNLEVLRKSLPTDMEVLCHLWPRPKNWPQLWRRYRRTKRKIEYYFIVASKEYSAGIDPMDLSGGRFCAVVYRKIIRKNSTDYVPVAFLNVTRDKILRHGRVAEK